MVAIRNRLDTQWTTITARYASWVDESSPSRVTFNKTGYVAVDGGFYGIGCRYGGLLPG